MLSRRKFIQNITAGAAAVMASGPPVSCSAAGSKKLDNIGFISGIIGRELREGDWKEVLTKTAGMGYTEI